METIDPELYRFSIFGKVAFYEGYGATPEEAKRKAQDLWDGNNPGEEPIDTVLEWAVPHGNGGSHYEEVSA